MAKCDAPSWADEVEEEHQATGWTGLPVEDACESTLAAEEGGKKTKNGKKKKKRGKGVQAFDTAETRSQNSVPKDEGWVTASSRKPYHNSAPIRRAGQVPNSGVEGYAGNGQIARNTEQVPWRSSETSALERAKSFDVPRGSGFQNLNGGRLGRATDDDWDIANEQKDKGQILVQRVRKVELQSSQNEVLGGRQLGTDSFQSLNTTSPGYSSSQKDRPTQVVGKEMSPPVSSQKENAKNGGINTNIMMKLLPSEKGGEFEHMKSASPSTSHTKNEQVEFYPPPQLVLKDIPSPIHSDSVCSDDDLENDSDWIASDIYDSDASDKSLDTKKNNKWFRSFFETLDNLGNEQVMEHDRQWHCPVCQGGVGAIDWYRGLQPLLAHAKTMRTKRVKLHREFAKILEEDLETRRAGIGVFGETKFGKWKGLRGDDETTNPLIVWPPMVVIQNTQLELDEHDKWIGMGNKELLDLFKDYNVIKARHAYGPQGHRGMSVVIFADSPTGYMNAEHLVNHFKDSRRGREHWDHPGKLKFHPGGDRILYGYMATAEDMDIFNRHSSGKAKLKWELKRYQGAVVQQMRQMDEDNQKLHMYRAKMQKQKEHTKSLEKTVSAVARKLELREKEISVIRQRAMEQHEQNQKEMDDLEESFKQTVMQMSKDSARREKELQMKQEEFKNEQLERCQQLENTFANLTEDKKLGEKEQQQEQAKMEEAIARQTAVVESTLKDTQDYEFRKRELTKEHHLRKLEFMRKQFDQALNFEKELEKEKLELLEKYKQQREDACSNV